MSTKSAKVIAVVLFFASALSFVYGIYGAASNYVPVGTVTFTTSSVNYVYLGNSEGLLLATIAFFILMTAFGCWLWSQQDI